MSVTSPAKTHSELVLDLVDHAVTLHPEYYPNLLVDALAYYLVRSDQNLDEAVERLKRSFSTISTAHSIITERGSRA